MSGRPPQDDGILAGVSAILARSARMNPSAVGRDSRLRDGFGIDSLAMIDLAVAAEDEFGVRIPDEAAERFETVGDVVDFIRRAGAGA